MIHNSDRVIITGCGGMLGEAVYAVFKDVCNVYATDRNVNTPWLDKLDVASSKAVAKYLSRVKPNYIIHLAAFTDMEYCELHPEEAYTTNTGGVENMAQYARDHNIPLLYISTAGIFDGEKDEYNEIDTPNPLSVYGKSKYGGELVARTLPKSIVIRAGWMMGGGPKKDKKFINKIIKQLRAGVKELAVVTDKYGTPCYTYDLAQSIKYLLDNEMYGGIYHGACEGKCNRYDVAVAIVKHFGLQNKVKVRKVTSDFVKEIWFAPRPRSEVMVNNELKKIAPHLTRDWEVCLDEYLSKFNWNLHDLNTSGMERSFYKDYFKIEREHWLMIGRRMFVKDQISKYLNSEHEVIKILDLGCGSGLFVEELAKAGYDSHGLDISSESVRFGELKGIKNIGVMDSHKINFVDKTFDVVLTLDFMQHLEDETWVLKEIYRVLKPGGIVVNTIPAYMWMWGIQDIAAHHYRRYTMKNFLKKINGSGRWNVIRSTYFNSFLFLPIAIFRLLNKVFKIRGRESDFDINNSTLNKAFSSIFSLERKFLKKINLPFGVSILVILKKN